MDFVSQSIKSRILAVSSLRIAKRNHGSFSPFCKKVALTTASIVSIKILSMRLPREYFCVLGMSS